MGNLIETRAAIKAFIEWYGCVPSDIAAFKHILEKYSVQFEPLTGFKSGCEYMQEKYYKLLKPLYDDCVKLENEIREKINSAPNDEFETPFILRIDWNATLRERTAFREMLESIIAKGALECLTAK